MVEGEHHTICSPPVFPASILSLEHLIFVFPPLILPENHFSSFSFLPFFFFLPSSFFFLLPSFPPSLFISFFLTFFLPLSLSAALSSRFESSTEPESSDNLMLPIYGGGNKGRMWPRPAQALMITVDRVGSGNLIHCRNEKGLVLLSASTQRRVVGEHGCECQAQGAANLGSVALEGSSNYLGLKSYNWGKCLRGHCESSVSIRKKFISFFLSKSEYFLQFGVVRTDLKTQSCDRMSVSSHLEVTSHNCPPGRVGDMLPPGSLWSTKEVLGQQLVDKCLSLGGPALREAGGGTSSAVWIRHTLHWSSISLPICKMRDRDRIIPSPPALIIQGSDRVCRVGGGRV